MIQTVDISGFGGTYEETCQRMLWRGVKFMEKTKPTKEQAKTGAYSEDVLAHAMTKGEPDVTGAMLNATCWHARYIYVFGYEQWLENAKKNNATIYSYPMSKKKTRL